MKLEVNYAGVGKLLKGQEMQQMLGSIAAEIAGRAGAGYESDVKVMGTRAIASAFTTDEDALADNFENNTLLKAVGG